jgi:hypothetical protein
VRAGLGGRLTVIRAAPTQIAGPVALAQSELRTSAGREFYTYRLLLPALRLSRPQSEAALIADIELLKAKREGDRTNDLPRSAQDLDDD